MKTPTTRRTLRHRLALLLALLASHMTGIVSAAPVEVDWTRSLLFRGSGGGLENPLLQVGFNPQPEPPAPGAFGYADPGMDGYPPDPVITHRDASAGDRFRLLFGIASDVPLVLGDGGFVDDLGQRFVQNVLGGDGTVSLRYLVEFELTTSSGGAPIDWVMFNPQPEPPALGSAAASFGADFSFDSFSDASLRLRVMDAAGTPVALLRVAEPTSSLLLALGFGCAAALRRRRMDARPERPLQRGGILDIAR